MNVLNYIKNRHENLKYADEIRENMATHIYGDVPTAILKRRRPLESNNVYALQYREDNFEPFSTSYFNLAISEVIESLEQLSFDIEGVSENTKSFIDNYKIHLDCIDYDLKGFCNNFISIKCEADPNGFVASIPVHPTQELIPDFRQEIPSFDDSTNKQVKIDVRYVSSKDVYYYDQNNLLFSAGKWLYKVHKDKGYYEKYFYHITSDYTYLAIPYSVKENEVSWKYVTYYANNTTANDYFKTPPFHILGHKITQKENAYYYESNFSGAVSYFNKAIGIESDLDVTVTKFVYPREYTYEDVCDAGCTFDNKLGAYGFYEEDGSCTTCNKCDGKGTIQAHTTPLGTTIVPKEQLFDDNGTFKAPYQFIQPPIDGVNFLDIHAFKWIEKGIEALYLTKQNITNASDKSKFYDLKQKITNRTKAAKNIIRIYQCLLNDVQAYLKGSQDIKINLPLDFKVKSSEDVTLELVESKGAPSIYTSSLTSELVLKRFGNNAVNRKIIDFLEINDILYGINSEEALKKKTNYGLVLDARVQLINDKGFFILKNIADENENFLNLSNAELKELFDLQVDSLLPAPIEPETLL